MAASPPASYLFGTLLTVAHVCRPNQGRRLTAAGRVDRAAILDLRDDAAVRDADVLDCAMNFVWGAATVCPPRSDAAVFRRGIFAPDALDFLKFGPSSTVPDQFLG